jgi:germacradienol/geosmin synthase
LFDIAARMQPFELPPFYMPYPARLNPYLEGARRHSKAWANEIGILGLARGEGDVAVWDERTFDAMDFAVFAAYTHPDAPPPMLELMTDWYVWSFFFDDQFLERFKRTRDLDGAKDYLARLSAFMPIHPTAPARAPSTPVERGLQDLWLRTVPTSSIAWRIRFIESTRDFLDESLWELANIRANRVPNPVEYIEMRRKVGGAPWAADLIEHAAGGEVPLELTATRPMRVLRDTFADGVHLRNDIFSYQREVEEEGENSNCVLVLERFLGLGVQAAADLTNDLLTSRLHQFENTALIEVPLLVQDHGLDAMARLNLLKYIKGLQDFQSGCHEWHLRSSRYMNAGVEQSRVAGRFYVGPTGLGTALAPFFESPRGPAHPGRVKPPREVKADVLCEVELPELYMPFAARLNPDVDAARRSSKTWAREMGMLDTGVWDERSFDRHDFPLCASHAHPDASAARLALVTDWHVWLRFFSDSIAVTFKRHRFLGLHDLRVAKALIDRLPVFVPEGSAVTPPPTNVVERALASVWSRTVPVVPVEWQRRFRRNLLSHLESTLWELLNIAEDRVPDPIECVEMRRATAGAGLAADLSFAAVDVDLPPKAFAIAPVRDLLHTFGDCMGLVSDIFSFRQDRIVDGNISNSVLVAQRFLDCELGQAVRVVNDVVTARLHQFEDIVRDELSAVFDSLALDSAERENFLRGVDALEHYLAGVLAWQRRKAGSDRFMPEIATVIPLGAVGFGTSGARVRSAARPRP